MCKFFFQTHLRSANELLDLCCVNGGAFVKVSLIIHQYSTEIIYFYQYSKCNRLIHPEKYFRHFIWQPNVIYCRAQSENVCTLCQKKGWISEVRESAYGRTFGVNWLQVKFKVSLLTSSQTPTAAQQKFVAHSRSCWHRGASNFLVIICTVPVLFQEVFRHYTSTVQFAYSGAVSRQPLSFLIHQFFLFPPSSLAGFSVTVSCAATLHWSMGQGSTQCTYGQQEDNAGHLRST